MSGEAADVKLTLIPPGPEQWQEFHDLPDEYIGQPGQLLVMLEDYLEAHIIMEVGGRNLTGHGEGVGVGLVELAVVLPWFVGEIEQSRDAEWPLWYLGPMLRTQIVDDGMLRVSICGREDPGHVWASAECRRAAFVEAASACADEAVTLLRAGMPPHRMYLVDEWLSEPLPSVH